MKSQKRFLIGEIINLKARSVIEDAKHCTSYFAEIHTLCRIYYTGQGVDLWEWDEEELKELYIKLKGE